MSVPGFDCTAVTLLDRTRDLYRRGSGAAVIVLSEIPGITPQVASFARRVADAGFACFMPQLFGEPMRPITLPYAGRVMAQMCVSREFRVLAANRSSPVVDWLRALARHVHAECGGPGIGVVGMCLTGNFGLAMMLDAPVIAPVLAQPSLPGGMLPSQRAGLHASSAEIAAAHEKIERHGARLLGLRFRGDPLCPAPRFERLRREFGSAFEAIELDNACAARDTPLPPHSMLTTHLIDRDGEPTHAALLRTLAFLRERLASA